MSYRSSRYRVNGYRSQPASKRSSLYLTSSSSALTSDTSDFDRQFKRLLERTEKFTNTVERLQSSSTTLQRGFRDSDRTVSTGRNRHEYTSFSSIIDPDPISTEEQWKRYLDLGVLIEKAVEILRQHYRHPKALFEYSPPSRSPYSYHASPGTKLVSNPRTPVDKHGKKIIDKGCDIIIKFPETPVISTTETEKLAKPTVTKKPNIEMSETKILGTLAEVEEVTQESRPTKIEINGFNSTKLFGETSYKIDTAPTSYNKEQSEKSSKKSSRKASFTIGDDNDTKDSRKTTIFESIKNATTNKKKNRVNESEKETPEILTESRTSSSSKARPSTVYNVELSTDHLQCQSIKSNQRDNTPANRDVTKGDKLKSPLKSSKESFIDDSSASLKKGNNASSSSFHEFIPGHRMPLKERLKLKQMERSDITSESKTTEFDSVIKPNHSLVQRASRVIREKYHSNDEDEKPEKTSFKSRFLRKFKGTDKDEKEKEKERERGREENVRHHHTHNRSEDENANKMNSEVDKKTKHSIKEPVISKKKNEKNHNKNQQAPKTHETCLSHSENVRSINNFGEDSLASLDKDHISREQIQTSPVVLRDNVVRRRGENNNNRTVRRRGENNNNRNYDDESDDNEAVKLKNLNRKSVFVQEEEIVPDVRSRREKLILEFHSPQCSKEEVEEELIGTLNKRTSNILPDNLFDALIENQIYEEEAIAVVNNDAVEIDDSVFDRVYKMSPEEEQKEFPQQQTRTHSVTDVSDGFFTPPEYAIENTSPHGKPTGENDKNIVEENEKRISDLDTMFDEIDKINEDMYAGLLTLTNSRLSSNNEEIKELSTAVVVPESEASNVATQCKNVIETEDENKTNKESNTAGKLVKNRTVLNSTSRGKSFDACSVTEISSHKGSDSNAERKQLAQMQSSKSFDSSAYNQQSVNRRDGINSESSLLKSTDDHCTPEKHSTLLDNDKSALEVFAKYTNHTMDEISGKAPSNAIEAIKESIVSTTDDSTESDIVKSKNEVDKLLLNCKNIDLINSSIDVHPPLQTLEAYQMEVVSEGSPNAENIESISEAIEIAQNITFAMEKAQSDEDKEHIDGVVVNNASPMKETQSKNSQIAVSGVDNLASDVSESSINSVPVPAVLRQSTSIIEDKSGTKSLISKKMSLTKNDIERLPTTNNTLLVETSDTIQTLPPTLTDTMQILPSTLADTMQTPPQTLPDIMQILPSTLTDTMQILPSTLADTMQTPPQTLPDTMQILPMNLAGTTLINPSSTKNNTERVPSPNTPPTTNKQSLLNTVVSDNDSLENKNANTTQTSLPTLTDLTTTTTETSLTNVSPILTTVAQPATNNAYTPPPNFESVPLSIQNTSSIPTTATQSITESTFTSTSTAAGAPSTLTNILPIPKDAAAQLTIENTQPSTPAIADTPSSLTKTSSNVTITSKQTTAEIATKLPTSDSPTPSKKRLSYFEKRRMHMVLLDKESSVDLSGSVTSLIEKLAEVESKPIIDAVEVEIPDTVIAPASLSNLIAANSISETVTSAMTNSNQTIAIAPEFSETSIVELQSNPLTINISETVTEPKVIEPEITTETNNVNYTVAETTTVTTTTIIETTETDSDGNVIRTTTDVTVENIPDDVFKSNNDNKHVANGTVNDNHNVEGSVDTTESQVPSRRQRSTGSRSHSNYSSTRSRSGCSSERSSEEDETKRRHSKSVLEKQMSIKEYRMEKMQRQGTSETSFSDEDREALKSSDLSMISSLADVSDLSEDPDVARNKRYSHSRKDLHVVGFSSSSSESETNFRKDIYKPTEKLNKIHQMNERLYRNDSSFANILERDSKLRANSDSTTTTSGTRNGRASKNDTTINDRRWYSSSDAKEISDRRKRYSRKFRSVDQF